MCQYDRWLKELGPAEFAMRMFHSDFQTDGHLEPRLPFITGPTEVEDVTKRIL